MTCDCTLSGCSPRRVRATAPNSRGRCFVAFARTALRCAQANCSTQQMTGNKGKGSIVRARNCRDASNNPLGIATALAASGTRVHMRGVFCSTAFVRKQQQQMLTSLQRCSRSSMTIIDPNCTC
eukprot:12185-Heterococcus_DN1.PRE.5